MPSADPSSESRDPNDTQDALGPLALRGALGGALMGLANLVPGVSGGTMLLAAGVYTRFVTAVADVTTFKWRRASLVLLASVAIAAFVAIAGLAAVLRDLVVEHRGLMYSLFIGLTLGGVPMLLKRCRPVGPDVLVPALVGIGAMVAMALLVPGGTAGASSPPYGMSLLAGGAGAAAMVLPGVSGGYLLLLLGMYVPILDAIATAKDAVRAGDVAAIVPALHVIIPVGIGVLVGVIGISNLVKWLLARAERPTLGVLLGLLLGAVVGLWPFQQAVMPEAGAAIRGDTVEIRDGTPFLATRGDEVEAKDWPTERFTPSAVDVGISAGLIVAGLAISLGIARVGGSDED